MSRTITSFFIEHGIVLEEDHEIYAYSFEIIISAVMSIAALTIVALLSRTVHYSALYLFGFISLRLVAGGYHAKSHLRCFLMLMVVYSTFLLLLSLLPAESALPSIVLAATSIVLVFLLAPLADKNKPISNAEAIRFRWLSRITVIAFAVVICTISVSASDNRLGFSLAVGVFTASASLPASYIKAMRSNGKTKNMEFVGKEGNNE